MFEPLADSGPSLGDDDRRALLYSAVIANTFLLTLLAYAIFTGLRPTVTWTYPLVWVTVGAWALFRTSPPPPTDRRTRRLATVFAVGYFLVLAYAGGLFGLSANDATGATLQVFELPPGWNPAFLYTGDALRVALVPYTAFGYAVLSYLVYATAIEARGAVAGGLLGLFSCVSCTLPVVASVLGGIVGGGGALSAAAAATNYADGTAVFVVTVLLLSYRPGFEWFRRRR